MAVKKPTNSSIVPKSSAKPAVAVESNLQVRLNRMFVLDTNVLLHDANSLFAFKAVVIVIPLVVLEELDTFKSENGERGRNAREVIRTLDELRSRGRLSEGVPLNKDTEGAILKVLPTPSVESTMLCINSVDNQIIHTVQYYASKGFDVTFVTKDINARVKADALGLDTEDYTKGIIDTATYYKGWTKIQMSATDLKGLGEKKVSEVVPTNEMYPNEFLLFENPTNTNANRIFRYLGGKNFKEVIQMPLLGGFQAKNVQQLMALDLLFDDSVKLVSLLGGAGTGKTFLTLLMGLQKVIRDRVYRRFMISRPTVALGSDLGFLPGDIQEKLCPWMQPVYDNLEFIFSQMSHSAENSNGGDSGPFGENAKDRRQRKRHPEQYDRHDKHDKYDKHSKYDKRDTPHAKPNSGPGGGARTDIDRLQEKGILSLEAITYMRGRSIPNQFVFIDEVQNLTPHEVKTIVSRAGEGTKVILAGDPYQIDSPYLDFTSNGLTVTSEKFKNQSIFGTVFLETSERSALAKLAAEIL